MDRTNDWTNGNFPTDPRGRSFRYGPSIRRLLTPKLEDISRLLWINRLSLTKEDRVWLIQRIDQIFDARLRK